MKRLASSLLGFLLLGWFVYRNRHEVFGIAIVLMYMAIFSLLLAPVCTRLERRGIRPAHAAGYAVIGLFLVVFLLFAAFIPYLITQSMYLFKRLAPVIAKMMHNLSLWTEITEGTGFSFVNLGSALGMTISGVTGKLIKTGVTAAQQIGRMGFSVILTYYVLCDRKRIGGHLLLFVPLLWRRPVLSALCACRNAMMSYFSGLLKTSAFVTAATCAGLLALGVQDAVLLSLLMGVFEILPYLGPVLASIPILLSAMLQGGETVLLAFALLVLVQQIEGNFITPYFTASSTSVHPFAAILGIFVAGSLFGVWGILGAVPLIALIQSIFWSFKQTQGMMKTLA